MIRIWLPAALIAAMFSVGCGGPLLGGRTCTLMDAPSNVTVNLDGDTSAVGEWKVEMTLAEITVVCIGEQFADSEDNTFECFDGGQTQLLSGPEGSVSSLSTRRVQDHFTVDVFHDDVEVASDDFEPEYTEREPNGVGCGIQRLATVSLTW